MTMLSRSRQITRAGRKALERGMTLLEIMVVITIIGVVMGTVAVAVIPRLEEARIDTTKAGIRNIETALKLYYTRHGRYPDTSAGLNVLVSEKMIEQAPKDAWGTDLVYTAEGSNKYQIISYGADGAAGGEGADADINSSTLNERK